jgi:hypothetical protein
MKLFKFIDRIKLVLVKWLKYNRSTIGATFANMGKNLIQTKKVFKMIDECKNRILNWVERNEYTMNCAYVLAVLAIVVYDPRIKFAADDVDHVIQLEPEQWFKWLQSFLTNDEYIEYIKILASKTSDKYTFARACQAAYRLNRKNLYLHKKARIKWRTRLLREWLFVFVKNYPQDELVFRYKRWL